jgi:hypothetical protein
MVFVLVSGLLLVREGVGESISRRDRFFSRRIVVICILVFGLLVLEAKKNENGIELLIMMEEGVTVL